MSKLLDKFVLGLYAGRRIICLSVALMLPALAAAQTASNPNIVILPYGIWQMCESSWGSQLAACNGFIPGSEQFLLMMRASSPLTTKFLFTVVATMRDGSVRVASGQVTRAENGAGYTSNSLYFGGIPLSFSSMIDEVVITSVQTGYGTFQP
jgi:hypothetical protein